MKTAVVYNIGCKVNQYECDTLISGLKDMGYMTSEQLIKADVYIVNTCAVTAEAERKSRQIISRIRRLNNDAYIMICGCASQKSKDYFIDKGIPFISGTANKDSILINIGKKMVDNADATKQRYWEPETLPMGQRSRAYVKIQDGCDNFCSYCIIPHLRGRSCSRSIENAVNEIRELAKTTDEIVITAINLSQYGKDIGTSLATLIREIKDIDVRIRLGSLYVEAIDDELLSALFSLKKFCPHFHLSLQHGDSDVLRSMNRRYSAQDYAEKVELIRKYHNMSAITTDIIVGYPTETEQAFENTLEFVKSTEFSDIHIFPFSKRAGTVAEKYETLPKNVVTARRNKLELVRQELNKNYLQKTLGIPQEVLFEGKQNGISQGYSRYYVRVYAQTDKKMGMVLPVEIYKDGLKGELL